MNFARPVLLTLAVIASSGSVACFAGPPPEVEQGYAERVRPFLARHCFECHGPEDGKAGLRLHDLGSDFTVGDNADTWKEVIDRINLGEMPPKDKPRPDPKQAFAVVRWVGSELKRAERQSRMSGGRVLLRRLNRREYINTVRDLLALDANFARTLEDVLPADGKAEGFDRVSAALFIDATQMGAYLAAARMIADEAIVIGPEPQAAKIVSEAEQQTRRTRNTAREDVLGERVEYPVGVQKYEFKEDGVLHIQSHFGYDKGPKVWGKLFQSVGLNDLVTSDGYYRIRIRAGASLGDRGEPIRLRFQYARQTPVATTKVVDLPHGLNEPDWVETVVFLRAGQPGQKRGLDIHWNGIERVIVGNEEYFKTIKNPSRNVTKEIAAAKKAGDKEALKKAYEKRDEFIRRAKEFDQPFYSYVEKYADNPDAVPKLFVDKIEVSGPVHETWPPRSHQKVTGGSSIRRAADEFLPAVVDEVTSPRGKGLVTSSTTAKFSSAARLTSGDPVVFRKIVERILPLAYRRPATTDEVDSIVAVIQRGVSKHDMSHPQAMRFGLQTMLCAPQFLYVAEPSTASAGPRPLNDYELASRLSYFLWSTMPDERLFQLAASSRLHEPQVLREQVERMLDDPRSAQFVESFAGQWLNVGLFGSIEPANQYEDYDAELEEASKHEALAFFSEVLGSDLPITSFLDSDFVVVNERLARHYGIEGVEGPQFRKVAIRPEHHRGGIFGMAGLMTLLSDGTRTLPVRRAAWIMENVFNDPPPPPPPNAGEIQPNTAGEKLTVRERLARHRDEPTCASCHTRLDPFGLALENYDAIGAWRTHANGENFRSRNAPELDVSGQLPSGRQFDDLQGFKTALLAERHKFAKAFSEKLLTYALSRPVGYVDRRTVEQLTDALKQNNYRLRSLIHSIVGSETFCTK